MIYPSKPITMITIQLTLKETLIMYGFMQGMIEKVKATPELDLIDRENTTNTIESIMHKVIDQLDNQTTNN